MIWPFNRKPRIDAGMLSTTPTPKSQYWRKWGTKEYWFVMYGRGRFSKIVGCAYNDADEQALITAHKAFLIKNATPPS